MLVGLVVHLKAQAFQYHTFTGQVALASLTVSWGRSLWYVNTSEACIYFPGAPLSSSTCSPQQGCATPRFASAKFTAQKPCVSQP